MGQITSRRFRRREHDSSSPTEGKAFSDGNIATNNKGDHRSMAPLLQPWTAFAHQTSSSSSKSTSAGHGLSSSFLEEGEGPSVTADRVPTLSASPFDHHGASSFGPSHYSDLTIDARNVDPGRLCAKPDPRLTASDVILRKRATGSGNGNGRKLGSSVQFPDDSKVSEVLSQTVTFLSYEIDPILIAEFIQHRTKRNRKNGSSVSGLKPGSTPPSVSDEDVSLVLSRLVSDLTSDDYRSFCDLIRRIGYDLHVLDFLEALDDLLRLVTSGGSSQATPLLGGRMSVRSSGCTCFLPSDDDRISWNRTPSTENLIVDRHFEIRFLYADRESRAAQPFTEVERLKRRKRRKSRLPVPSSDHVLGDTSDRYVPMMSVRLFNSCLCEVQMRRLGRILESHACIRDLAVVETRFDTAAKIRLGHSLGQTLCLFQLDLRRSSLGNDGVMYLANGLRRNDSIRVLNLSQNGINGRGCALLVRALALNRTLAELDLGFNEVSDAGCRHLAAAIGTNNSSLRHLRLPSNGIGSPGAKVLFRALRGNYRLQGLDLSDNPIGDGSVEVLSEVLIVNRTLREVALNNCRISHQGCPSLARAFKANMKLRTLKLADNPIGDVGLTLVADGVKYNRALEELVFDSCGITDAGLLQLLDATRHNATLKSVHLCRNSITLACRTSLPSQPPYLLHCWTSPVLGREDPIGYSRYWGGPLSAQEIYLILRQANPSLTIVLKENGITKSVI